jgi:hypothetical protein
VSADKPTDLQAVQFGQHDIEQDHVGVLGQGLLFALETINGMHDLKPLPA